MWLRCKAALVVTTLGIVQITTSLETTGIKTNNPFVNANNAKSYKNTSPKTSMYKAYNFPETEFPLDSTPRDPFYLGRNTNPVISKYIPNSRCKACNDLKKDLRMKRKLDRIRGNYKTSLTDISPAVSIKLADTDMFPEVQYPLNARDTWAPHFWNPSIFGQKEEQYDQPEYPIFNLKMSDKSKKALKPYKKQTKSKTKQFMEDIDIFNEKMRSTKSQSKKTRGTNTEKDLADTYTKNSESFNQPEVNDNINVTRMAVETIPNKTAEEDHDAITTRQYQCPLNANITESRELKNQYQSLQVNSTLTESPLPVTSQMECTILDKTPIPYKGLVKNNYSSEFESTNIKGEDINRIKDGKHEYMSNGPPFSKADDLLDEEVTTIIPNTTNSSQQQPGKVPSTTDGTVTPPAQNDNTTATITNDNPLNVKIPLPVANTYDKIPTPGFMTKTAKLSNANGLTHATIIVLPISKSLNKNQIPIVESSTGSPTIVFMPTTETDTTDTVTSNDTLHTSPLIAETVSNDAFNNVSKIFDNYEPLQINVTDLPDIISNMMEIPDANVIDIPCNTFSTTKLLSPYFEMLPNNSMCHVAHVLSNEVKSTNMISQPFNNTKYSDGILSVIDNPSNNALASPIPDNRVNSFIEINTRKALKTGVADKEAPLSVENFVQNYTYLGLPENSISLHNVDTIDIGDNSGFDTNNRTSLPQVVPTSYVHTHIDETARLLAVSKLIDLLLGDLVKKDPTLLVDKILPEKTISDLVKNVDVINLSKDINFHGTALSNDTITSTTSSEYSVENNVTTIGNIPQQNQSTNTTEDISAPRQNELTELFDQELPIIAPGIQKLSKDFQISSQTEAGGRFQDLLLCNVSSLDSCLDTSTSEIHKNITQVVGENIPLVYFQDDVTQDGMRLIPEPLPSYAEIIDTPLSDNIGDDISSFLSMELPKSLLTDKLFDGALLLSNDNKSIESLLGDEEPMDTPFSDSIEDHLSDNLLTSKTLLDTSLISNESHESLPVYEALRGSPLSDTIGDDMSLPFPMKLPDTFVDTPSTSSDIDRVESLESLPVNEALIGSPLSDTIGDEMSLPLPKTIPDTFVDTALTSSDIDSVESLPVDEVLIGSPLSDTLGDDMSLPLPMQLPDTFVDTALMSSDIDSVEPLPVHEALIGSPLSDTIEDDMSLPLSMKLPDTFVNTPLTSSDIDSVESLPVNEALIGSPTRATIGDDMSIPMKRLDKLIDTTSSDIENVESVPVSEELTDTPFSDGTEDDISLSLSSELPYVLLTDKAFLDTSLISTEDESLESLTDYKELKGIPFNDRIDDDISLSWSMEQPDSLPTDEASLDTSFISTDDESIESLLDYDTFIGYQPNDSTGDDISSPLSTKQHRFVDTPLTSSDNRSHEPVQGNEVFITTPLTSDIENDMSLSTELPDSLLADKAPFDTSLASNYNKSLESLQGHQPLLGNRLNENEGYDMLPIQLPDNNDKAIQGQHDTGILQEGIFMDKMEPMSADNDKRLLTRNTLPDRQESDTKKDEVMPANTVINVLNNSPINSPVDKQDTNDNVIANNISNNESGKELLNKQLSEITADGKPLFVDETLTDSRSIDDFALEINRISQIVPSSNTKAISGDLEPSINEESEVFGDKELSSSELSYINKYLYDAV